MLTSIKCSVGAAVQGWDQTGEIMFHYHQAHHNGPQRAGSLLQGLLTDFLAGSNGANLSFPQYFHLDKATTRGAFLIGLINAAPYLGSALGCWFSDPLNSFFGRRGTIFVSANFCLWSVFGSAWTQTWQQLVSFNFLGCQFLLWQRSTALRTFCSL